MGLDAFSCLLSSAGRRHHFIDEETELRKVKRLVQCHTGDKWQDRDVSPGLAEVIEEVIGVYGGGESDTRHAQTPTSSAIHSSIHLETKPAIGARTIPHSYTLSEHIQAHIGMDTSRDGHCTCRRLMYRDRGVLTHLHSHTHSPTESQTHMLSHRHSSSNPREIFCCGHMMAHRDMPYGQLMGRPHKYLGHQQNASSHKVRERINFDECIENFSIRKGHMKVILIFIFEAKFT